MACVKFSRSKHGTVGCTVGLAPHVFVGAYGTDPVDALKQATLLASQMNDLIDKNPALAVIPGIGQVAAAMKAINAASSLIQKGGSLKDVTSSIGPAAASVVTSLLKSFL